MATLFRLIKCWRHKTEKTPLVVCTVRVFSADWVSRLPIKKLAPPHLRYCSTRKRVRNTHVFFSLCLFIIVFGLRRRRRVIALQLTTGKELDLYGKGTRKKGAAGGDGGYIRVDAPRVSNRVARRLHGMGKKNGIESSTNPPVLYHTILEL